MSQFSHIFVYGTLRPPRNSTPPADSRYHSAIADHIITHQPATLHDAELYDLGAYPAAVPGAGVIRGDLLTVTVDALPIADRVEGHPTFYRRAQVTVQTDDGAVTAWVYWAPPGLHRGRRRIAHGDWFRRHESRDAPPAESNTSMPVDPTLRVLVERFANADCSWLSSVRPDGRVHSAPMWHVWHQGRVYVVASAKAVKTRNIAKNPSVVLTHPDPHDALIIEGWATTANALRTEVQPLFQAKYAWNIATDTTYDTVIEITPTKLIAWGQHGAGRWSGTDVIGVG